jgi:hypothetical protein
VRHADVPLITDKRLDHLEHQVTAIERLERAQLDELHEEFVALLWPNGVPVVPETWCVSLAYDGGLEPVLIVYLETNPAWLPRLHAYKGLRVLWKVLGRWDGA